MQWGQIKTVFIICFLILNVFLVKQLLDRQDEDITFIPVPSREDELEFNIGGLDDLSEESFSASLLYAQNYNYNNEAATDLGLLEGQQIVVVNHHYLFSRFDQPVSFDFENPESNLNQYVLNGNSYHYWGMIEPANVLVFFQEIEYPVFYNTNAILFIQLNDEGHMTQYVQTKLEGAEEPEEDRTLIQQYDAVYRLYHHSNALEPGDTISNVELGYHNIVSLPNGEQILNPTWGIHVNDSEHYFINALEGHNYPQNDHFYRESILALLGILDNAEPNNRRFYHLEDDPDEFILDIRQALNDVYQNIIEVDVE